MDTSAVTNEVTQVTARITVPNLPVIVQIGIVRNSGQPPELFVDSGMRYEPKVWVANTTYGLRPFHSDRVMWVASGLEVGESIGIVPKPAQHPFFESTNDHQMPKQFHLDFADPVAHSGPVTSFDPLKGPVQVWSYNIVLNSGTSQLATLDPVIIIEEEP